VTITTIIATPKKIATAVSDRTLSRAKPQMP
jgi:hypothetical protein